MSKFSVLLPVYYKDNPAYFDMSLKSIFDSSVVPNEIVVVEDGPLSSELIAVLERYHKKHPEIIRIIKLEKNMGLGTALAYGTEACSYNLVARMDADDICCRDRFEKQLAVFKQDKNLSIVGSNVIEYDEDMKRVISAKMVPEKSGDIVKYCKKRNPFNHMSVMFKKEDVFSVGNYQPMDGFEDYYLWCRLLMEHKGYNLQQNLVKVRGGDSMYKRRGGLGYAKKIIAFQRAIHKIGFISLVQRINGVIIRVPIAVSPVWMKGLVYKKALRREAQDE